MREIVLVWNERRKEMRDEGKRVMGKKDEGKRGENKVKNEGK